MDVFQQIAKFWAPFIDLVAAIVLYIVHNFECCSRGYFPLFVWM